MTPQESPQKQAYLSALRILKISQNELAEIPELDVSVSTLSRMFDGEGARKNALRRDVAKILDAERQKRPLSKDEADELYRNLRILEPSLSLLRPTDQIPTGPLAPGNPMYIQQDSEEDANIDEFLRRGDFLLGVTGPLQCGKTTFLLRLHHQAVSRFDYKVATFDLSLLQGTPEERLEAELWLALREKLLLDWEVKMDFPVVKPYSRGLFSNDLKRLLQNDPDKRRKLLIIDEASVLTAAPAHSFTQFIRAAYNRRSIDWSSNLSIAIGICHKKYFPSDLIQHSSAFLTFEIEPKWFRSIEIKELVGKFEKSSTPPNDRSLKSSPLRLEDVKPTIRQIFDLRKADLGRPFEDTARLVAAVERLFAGQPQLTHYFLWTFYQGSKHLDGPLRELQRDSSVYGSHIRSLQRIRELLTEMGEGGERMWQNECPGEFGEKVYQERSAEEQNPPRLNSRNPEHS